MILYPDSGKTALISANQPVQVPAPSAHAEDDWIRFDKDWGVEQLWIIWSVKPVQTLEAVKKWSNPTDLGEIKDASQDKEVREFLESQEGALAEGKRDLSGRQTTVAGKGNIVAYRLSLQHH